MAIIRIIVLKRSPDKEGIETPFVFHASSFATLKRSPDKEGIETKNGPLIISGPFRLKRSPDKEGIETARAWVFYGIHQLKRSPDKEGIETWISRSITRPISVETKP